MLILIAWTDKGSELPGITRNLQILETENRELAVFEGFRHSF
jgi:hypothetical protein